MTQLQTQRTARVTPNQLRRFTSSCRTAMTVIDWRGRSHRVGGLEVWESDQDIVDAFVPALGADMSVVVVGKRNHHSLLVRYEVTARLMSGIDMRQFPIVLRMAEYQEIGVRRFKFDGRFFRKFGALGVIPEEPTWHCVVDEANRSLRITTKGATRLHFDKVVGAVAYALSSPRARCYSQITYESADEVRGIRLTPYVV